MKKVLIFAYSVSILFFVNLAFAETNLIGTWETDGVCLHIGEHGQPTYNGDPMTDGVTSTHNEYIVIVWQEEKLFKGYVLGVETPNGIIFGTINGNKFTMTQWDAIVHGEVKKKGKKVEMSYTSQHALDNPPSAPGTCIGHAEKISDQFYKVESFEEVQDTFPGDCTAVEISDPFNDFYWDPNYLEVTKNYTYTSSDCDSKNSYGAPSGIHAVHNGWGHNEIEIYRQSGTFNFIGAFFTSWAYEDNYNQTSALSVTLEGYSNNTLVGSTTMALSPNRYDWFQADLQNIDELVIVAPAGEKYWLMDDFTYELNP
jgi:hypothetical protein